MSQPETSQSSNDNSPSEEKESFASSQDSTFECNICLDTAKDAVVSFCGHLFCWPCLHQWLEIRPNRQLCPVCKADINRNKVIPVYGRGGCNQDPREKLPPRPQGQRTEPENNGWQSFPGFGYGDFHSFGFFPSSFGEIWQEPFYRAPRYGEEQNNSKIFLWIAIVFILWLLTL